MQSDPLTLSIVIPVYNEEDYIRLCLDAVQNQSVQPDEVIVVDNNSTDRTVEVAKSYPFVRVIKESQQGVLHARTTGFNAVKTDLIGRIDADTRLPKDWIKIVKNIFRDEQIAAVNGPAAWYDMPRPRTNYKAEDWFKSRFYHKYKGEFPFLLGANMAMRTSAWKAVSSDVCRDNHLYEDTDLAIHLQRAGYNLAYDKRMHASLSARRLDTHPWDFWHYINIYKRTSKKHGFPLTGPQLAVICYSLGYLVLQPIRRAYDPTRDKLSWRKFFSHKIPARRNPTD